jgi:hypothetical protein
LGGGLKGTPRCEDVDATHPWQVEIEQHQIVKILVQSPKGLCTVGRGSHDVPGVHQDVFEYSADFRLVIHYENAARPRLIGIIGLEALRSRYVRRVGLFRRVHRVSLSSLLTSRG